MGLEQEKARTPTWHVIVAFVQVAVHIPLGHNSVQTVLQVLGHVCAGVLVDGQTGGRVHHWRPTGATGRELKVSHFC